MERWLETHSRVLPAVDNQPRAKRLRNLHRSFGVKAWNGLVRRVVEREFLGKFFAACKGLLSGHLVDGFGPAVPRNLTGDGGVPKHPSFGKHLEHGLGIGSLPPLKLWRCCQQSGGFVNADRLEAVRHQHQLVRSDDTRSFSPHHRFNLAHHGSLRHDGGLEQVVHVPRDDVPSPDAAETVIGPPQCCNIRSTDLGE